MVVNTWEVYSKMSAFYILYLIVMQVGPAILVLGNEAQRYGLKVSLLERLHKQYKGIPCAETHCATLLNNYRCHKVLLSLPSYLFYNSALVPKVDTDAQLHPIDKTPLHFICSDLDDSTTEVVNSSNYKELKMLLDKAVEYTSPWPDEWGPKDLSTICIMTATGNQVCYFRFQYYCSLYIYICICIHCFLCNCPVEITGSVDGEIIVSRK